MRPLLAPSAGSRLDLRRPALERLARLALDASPKADVRVRVEATREGNTRFANNLPTTTGDVERIELSVTVSEAGRVATASGTASTEAQVRAIVAQAEALAAVAPVDPEAVGPLGPQRYARVSARDGATAAAGAERRADHVRAAIARAREVGQVCAGLSTHGETALLVANKAGLSAFHAETSATFGVTMRTTDGTGSANAARAHHRWGAIDPALAATLASIKADLSRSPRALPPADMTVVLEAQAVADLLSFLAGAMDERAAVEGRSVFARTGGATAVGERLFDPRITLRSDPADREHPSLPFDREGLPRAPQAWIQGGTLQALPRSRAFAAARGVPAIAAPGSWFMAGGDATVDQLIAGVDRGVLVSRLWYNRMVEPRTLLATGLTRDGTFAIESGALAGSVKNFRYNDSPLTLLKRVVALGKPERVGLANGVWVVPPMVVEGFHFESSSDAI